MGYQTNIINDGFSGDTRGISWDKQPLDFGGWPEMWNPKMAILIGTNSTWSLNMWVWGMWFLCKPTSYGFSYWNNWVMFGFSEWDRNPNIDSYYGLNQQTLGFESDFNFCFKCRKWPHHSQIHLPCTNFKGLHRCYTKSYFVGIAWQLDNLTTWPIQVRSFYDINIIPQLQRSSPNRNPKWAEYSFHQFSKTHLNSHFG